MAESKKTEAKKIVNVIANIYNQTKDKTYKLSINPRELSGILPSHTLEQELVNSELVEKYVRKKSDDDGEELEIINFDVITK